MQEDNIDGVGRNSSGVKRQRARLEEEVGQRKAEEETIGGGDVILKSRLELES